MGWSTDKAFNAWLDAEDLGTDNHPLHDEVLDLIYRGWQGARPLQDPRFDSSPLFEGYDVADWRELYWLIDNGLMTAEASFVWPSEDEVEAAIAADSSGAVEIDLREVAQAMTPELDIAYHETGLHPTTSLETQDGMLYFVNREQDGDDGPWVLLDLARRIVPNGS